MNEPSPDKITIDKVPGVLFKNKNTTLDVLRLDKIHPVISGNKWYKLKYHLENFYSKKYNGILTFGGAWSNHLIATACTCFINKIDCVGIVRGEKPPKLSYTLSEAAKFKMHLNYISRSAYSQKEESAFKEKLMILYPEFYIVPEGGAGPEGEKGAAEIMKLVVQNDYTHIICAVGTGTMLKGLLNARLRGQEVKGIVVLKGYNEVTRVNDSELIHNYHFGGYAKFNNDLLDFMNKFFGYCEIPTDIVYTGKLAYGIVDMINKNHFPPQSKILMIHSGGLQGNNSLEKGSLIF